MVGMRGRNLLSQEVFSFILPFYYFYCFGTKRLLDGRSYKMEEILIVEGARTPFGSYGGSLKDVSAMDLAIVASKGAMERAQVQPEQVDNVVFGNVIHTAPNAAYLSRHIA